MADPVRWDLPRQIIELSDANTWGQAVREWSLNGIEMLDPGEFDSCLCGHYPIRELCHLLNRENGNTAIVGNHCIEKFDKDDPGHEVFGEAPRIVQAAGRILQDPMASANEALINFAERTGVFTTDNATFYREIWRKRNLSDGQERYKRSLNQQLLYRLILSVRGAYQRLLQDPQRGTAGPKLAQYAFAQGVIRERDRDFYLQKWDRAYGELTQGQQGYRSGLNQRIIQQLNDRLNQEGQRRIA